VHLLARLTGVVRVCGWPTAVLSVRGWLTEVVRVQIGQGTYSNVYKARDLEDGSIVALKKVRFDNLEAESVRFMAREIEVLRRLDHPNIVKLKGLVTSRVSCSLYLVFEYMEHDLAGLAACPGVTFTDAQIKCYMLQVSGAILKRY
jgi:cyclin-dependent kinase 12/13